MDPFKIEESSTPSPQNNGSGDSAQSVSSDDFEKVEKSPESLLDLDFEGQDQQITGDNVQSMAAGSGDLVSGPLTGDEDQTVPADVYIPGHDNHTFKDSPAENIDPMSDFKPVMTGIPGSIPSAAEVLKNLQNSDDEDFQESPSEDLKNPLEAENEYLATDLPMSPNVASPLIKVGNSANATSTADSEFKSEPPVHAGVVGPETEPEKELFDPPVTVTSKPVILEEVKKSEKKDDKKTVPSSSSPECCVLSPGVWFDKEKLNPKVADLLYWKDVKKTGMVFGSILLVLLSLAYFSLISVVAYSSLTLLGITMSFRIYKSIITAVQKSNEGHPFKECLDKEFSLSPEKVEKISDFILERTVSISKKIKSLFLVEDIVDSLKFGLVLWGLTYIGAWFNGMTLLILAFVFAFTLPKVYETHQTQIDHYLGIAMAQVKDVMDKVKAKVPMLNKKKDE